MSEFEEIPIPMSERVKISDLKLDPEDNPNRMTLAQLERLKASIKRWGGHRSRRYEQ